MSSPSQFGSPMSATCSPSARHPSMYRQTDYHHEKGFRVIESRRRSPVIMTTKSTQKVHALTSTSREQQLNSSRESPNTSSQPSHLRSTSPYRQSNHSGHVTPRSSSRSKPKVVIVQGSVSVSVDFGKRDVVIDLATPPPTPKIGRLATPELDDFDERPFCHCCTDIQVVKYCAGCGHELHR